MVFCMLTSLLITSDVTVHKTNSFLRPDFQFKQNILLRYITVIEMKIKLIRSKTTRKYQKPIETKGNFEFEKLEVKKRIDFDTKKAKR
jgi:hypothetical protein